MSTASILIIVSPSGTLSGVSGLGKWRAIAAALEAEGADIAMAATIENGERQVQPGFCLMKTALMESLVAFTASGQRKIDRWTAQHRCVEVMFDDPNAFFNANTLAELQQLQR